MCKFFSLEDFNGDFESFVTACYSSYCSLWKKSPVFNNKPIVRDTTAAEKGFEKTFWGIVEGHDESKIYDDLIRYKRISLLNRILATDCVEPNNQNSDIKWFVFDKNKRLFSEHYMYEIILKEMRTEVFLVTAFPINERRLCKDKELWKIYWKNKNG